MRFIQQLLIMIACGPGSVLGFRDIAVFNVDMLPASRGYTGDLQKLINKMWQEVVSAMKQNEGRESGGYAGQTVLSAT